MGLYISKESYERLKTVKGRPRKPPNTTLKRILNFLLPRFCSRFLWSQPKEFLAAKIFLGAGIGGLYALGVCWLLILPMTISEDYKVDLMYGMAGVGALGWATSPHFRCASLMVIPKFVGKEGRLYILTYVFATMYDGPIANIRHNLREVVRSISCTVDLQIENAKRTWKVSLAPLRTVLKDMVGSKDHLKSDTQDISNSFVALNNQVASEEGYDANAEKEKLARRGKPSTQQVYEVKTRLRCSAIIQQAIYRCKLWFAKKHSDCMKTIKVPIINHLLCLPMKFSFICHLARIMNTWCQDKIPVEGNFGQTYDRVNNSVDNLNQDFTTRVVVKEEQQAMLVGANLSHKHLVDEVNEQVAVNGARLNTAISVFRVILSCTFIFVFSSAYSYTNSYTTDIRFDNLYISRYFQQIDARRWKQKKRTLLPLRRAERSGVINPYSLCFQPAERKNVMLELLGCMPTLIFILLAFALDYVLFIIFSTIRHHSFVEYSFRSSHHLEVRVGGTGMIAKLLRSTIGALNTSSETMMGTNNLQCLPEAHGMAWDQYVDCAIPFGALIGLCFLQVYGNRLRRIIAAFYFPKREKKRILFLYNEMLRQRIAFITVQRKRIIQRARRRKHLEAPFQVRLGRWFPILKRFIRHRCILCNLPQTSKSRQCPNPDCGAVYCRICWEDMGRVCYACSADDVLSDDSSDGEPVYAE